MFGQFKKGIISFLIRFRIVFLSIAILFVTMVLVVFMFRGAILKAYVRKKAEHFNSVYPASLTIGEVKMRGLNSILIRNISLKPFEGDTLLKVDSVYASVRLSGLFVGKIILNRLDVSGTSLRMSVIDSSSNFTFLLHKKKSSEVADTIEQGNYAKNVSDVFDALFDRLPNSMEIYRFSLLFVNDEHKVDFHLDHLSVVDHSFKGPVMVTEDGNRNIFIVSGIIDKGLRKAGFNIYSNKYEKVIIPFLRHKWNAEVEFDTVSFSLSGKRINTELMKIEGYAFIRGLYMNHEKIAEDDVVLDRVGVNYSINFGKDFAELDSSTVVTFNRLDFHPYIRYRPKPTRQITFSLHKPDFPAQDLFSSLPEGLFSTLDGIKVKGELSWDIDFFVDLSIPDSLRFNSEMKRKNFSVVSWGNTALTRINEPFLYTAYERGQAVRSFMVGPVNPEFRYLSNISDYLKVSVLTSEDAGFYGHNGFIMDALRESMITNIKQERFARGGSTITMQMVKNVFLNRNKTLGRKVEEMLITWLIETQHLSSKDRIFEVYLNIIEWGPLVYGANEASRFYFNKDASRLNLAEAIFLSSIIPHPKWWKSSFTPEGHLRPSMTEFYNLVSSKMLRRGQISQYDYDHLKADVELRGAAKKMFEPSIETQENPPVKKRRFLWFRF